MPSAKYRELRHLVQLRDTHVQQLTATKCRIKALLLYEGIAFPSDAGKEKQWSARVLDELLELPCSETVRFKLDQLIGTLYFNFKRPRRRKSSCAITVKRMRNLELG